MVFLRLASCALTVPSAASTLVLLQSAITVAEGWLQGARVNPAAEFQVLLALRPQRLELLGEEVLAVSSPRSDRYGQHLSVSEIAALTGPSGEARSAVVAWLAEAGLQGTWSRWGDRVEVIASVEDLEHVFNTQMHEYTMPGRAPVLEAGSLWAPSKVAAELDAVFGLHGGLVSELRRDPVFPSTDASVTPSLLRTHYGIEGVPVKRGSANRRATAAFQRQYTSQEDLTAFFNQFVSDAQPGDDVYSCVPDSCEGKAGIEAQLDSQYLMGVVPGITTDVWAFQELQWCTALKRWTGAVLDADAPPSVFSVSYGVQYNTTDYERFWGCTEEMASNIEADFTKIAARGVSLIFASGDSGSAGGSRPGLKLWPAWPGSAPHATAVGGTAFIGGDPAQGERSSTSFASGGGFDWRWSRPSWQIEAVDSYLSRAANLPQESDFNRDGRATPDVSVVGEAYQVVNAGTVHAVGGTSASAPAFASMVSLLNEYRLQNGQSPLGFLNPLLYELASHARGWTDILIGDNKPTASAEGYSCTEGWDPVTGLGTPKFEELLEYIKTLPSGKVPTPVSLQV